MSQYTNKKSTHALLTMLAAMGGLTMVSSYASAAIDTGSEHITLTKDTDGTISTNITNYAVTITANDPSMPEGMREGTTRLGHDGIRITPAQNGTDVVVLSRDGLDNGNNRIINVQAGAQPNDAVNVSQLSEVSKAAADAQETADTAQTAAAAAQNTANTAQTAAAAAQNTANAAQTAAAAAQSTADAANTAATAAQDTADQAIAAAAAAKTTVVAGDNNINVEETATSPSTYSISLADNISVTSVSAGNTTVNNQGVSIANGPSMTANGIDAGSKVISNVAAGVNDTDAVNVGQLNAANDRINQRIEDNDKKAKAGVAQALAVAGLPQAYLPGKSMVAVAGGYYDGETGYALGVSSISDNGHWIVKGAASGNSRSKFGVNTGVGYQW